MRRGRGRLFGGRAGGVSASFLRAPPLLHPALPVRGGGARGTAAGGRPLFSLGSPRPVWGFPSVGAAGRQSVAGDQRGTSHF